MPLDGIISDETKGVNGSTTTDGVQLSTADQSPGQKTEPLSHQPTGQTQSADLTDAGTTETTGDFPSLAATAGKDTGASLPTDSPAVTDRTGDTIPTPLSTNNSTAENELSRVSPSGGDETTKDLPVLPTSGLDTGASIVAGLKDEEEEKLFSEGEDDKKADDDIPEVRRTRTLSSPFVYSPIILSTQCVVLTLPMLSFPSFLLNLFFTVATFTLMVASYVSYDFVLFRRHLTTHSCQHGLKKMRDVLLISLAFT